MKNKLIIIAGCSGSGKSTVAKKICNIFSKKDAQIICIDRFYKKNVALMPKLKNGHANFDHPKAFDWSLLRKCLKSLLCNKSIKVPQYDYAIHARKKHLQLIRPTKIIIFEGFLALYDKQFNNMAELKIFVDTDEQDCFKRRLKRDQIKRQRTVKSIKTQWNESVLPMYNKYVKPCRWVADLILPWDKINNKSIKYLTQGIKHQLKSR